jgi:hypothetical protein
MLFSLNKLLVIAALILMAGCIADTAEDSDLPWARDQGWEGQIPIPGNMPGQYD